MALIACPECAREISAAAPQCVGCGHPFVSPVRREGGEGLRMLGWSAVLLGFVGLIGSAMMDTSVEAGGGAIAGIYLPERVQNVGLMNDKQNWLFISGVLIVAGLGLVRIGYVQREAVRIPVRRTGPTVAVEARIVARCAACSTPLTSDQARHFKGQTWCDQHFDEQISGVAQTVSAHLERR